MQRGGAGEEAGDPRHLWSASQTARYKDKSPPLQVGASWVPCPPPSLARPLEQGLCWAAGQTQDPVACRKSR